MNKGNAYRYPGSRPFLDNDLDRRLFFGREREKEELFYKVLAKQMVVLFAKSGLGKTSLINAGLNQMLREKGFVPLIIRFNDPMMDPVNTVFSHVEEGIKYVHNLDYEPGEKKTLWQFFKTTAFRSTEDNSLIPVLILDQFEEFFLIHGQIAKRTFISQLADLVNGTIPSELRQSLEKGKPFRYTEGPPNIKILISMREDYLAYLDEFSEEIPDILHNRFHLMPLTREQAREAITKPAQVEDDQIRTSNFKYTNDALDMMMDFLSTQKERGGVVIKDEIESFQLQLLCMHIENNILSQAEEGKNNVVTKENLGGEHGMRRVLQYFYENQLAHFRSAWQRMRVRKLCEKGLISVTNRRLSLEEEVIERRFKVSRSLLQYLVNIRMVRAEVRLGSFYYELSHDTLIAPIRYYQRKRRVRVTKVTIFFVIILIIIYSILFQKYCALM